MSDIQHLMRGFNAELAKEANLIGDVGLQALKNALGGIKGFNPDKFRVPAAAMGMKAMRGLGRVASDTAGAVGRFGQRQVHGLTGWTPKGYMNQEGIRGMRAGAYEAAERLGVAERAVQPAPGRYRPGLVDRVLGRSEDTVKSRAVKAGQKELASAKKAYESAQKAEDMGLTSLPGYAQALMKNPGEALKAGLAEQWTAVGPAGKAMMVGIPAAGVASEMSRESAPGEAGRLERAGSRLGELAYTMGPIPVAGQIAAGMGVTSLGKHIGRVMDRTTRPKQVPAPPSLDPAGGEAAPSETIISDRAIGIGQGGSL